MAVINIGIPQNSTFATSSHTFNNRTMILGNYNNNSGYEANNTGLITSFSIKGRYNTLVNCKVVILYKPSIPNDSYIVRSVTSLGDLSFAGEWQTFSGLNLEVFLGDTLGIYAESGSISYVSGVSFQYIEELPVVGNTYVTSGGTGSGVAVYGVGITDSGKKWNGTTVAKWNGIAVSKLNGI